MDNPEILATLGTHDEDKQNKKQKTKKISNNVKGKQFLLLTRHQLCSHLVKPHKSQQ